MNIHDLNSEKSASQDSYKSIQLPDEISRMDDYKKLTVHGSRIKGLETSLSQKGHFDELQEFAANIKSGTAIRSISGI